MKSAIRLNRLGEPEEINYQDLNDLKTKFIISGKNLKEYEYLDFNIYFLSFINGDEKIINKTELPPPFDEKLFYGDIIFFKKDNNLSVKDYQTFYEEAFGGFEDLDDTLLEDELTEEDDYDYDDSFIASDDD